jgi:hypothetical protein
MVRVSEVGCRVVASVGRRFSGVDGMFEFEAVRKGRIKGRRNDFERNSLIGTVLCRLPLT